MNLSGLTVTRAADLGHAHGMLLKLCRAFEDMTLTEVVAVAVVAVAGISAVAEFAAWLATP